MSFVLAIGTFEPGRILVVQAPSIEVDRNEVLSGLNRHLAQDWGDVGESDRKANEDALCKGGHLFSRYRYGDGKSFFYVTTEPDRSLTRVLILEDY